MSRVVGPLACITNVVASVEEQREIDLTDLVAEFDSSRMWLANALESCKRKIMESSGSYQEPGKRLRVAEKPIEKDPAVRKEKSSSQSNNNEEYDHSENDIDISSLRVVDLKEELQKRGLETSGLKKVLQQRLQSALDASSKMEKSTPPVTNDAMEIEAPTTTCDSKTVAESNVSADDQRDYVVQDIHMDDIEKNKDIVAAKVSESEESDDRPRTSDERAHDVNDTQEPKNLASARFADDVSVMTESTGIDGSQKKKNLGQKLFKATSKLFSPNKNKGKSPMKKMDPSPSVKYDMHKSSNTFSSANDSSTGSRTQTEEKQDESFSKSKRGLESVNKASGIMSTAAVKRAEEKKKIQAALSGNKGITDTTSVINQKDPISMLKTPAATNMVPSKASGDSKSSSASSETSASSVASSMKGTASSVRAQAKTKAYADARKARLEEIRGKSKPVALAQVPSTNQTTGQSGENNLVVGSHLASKIAHKSGTGHGSVLSSTNSTSATEKRKLFTEQMREKAKQAEAHAIRAAAAAKKQMEANAMREKAAAAQKQAAANILSPMQTYEMSDREGSDSDDDSSVDEDEAKKKIPAWAQRTNLLKALQKQFDPSVNRYDPDVLFSEVQTCDLTAIFGPSEKRQYRERKSTGNWTNDQVTVAEKLTYKRKMGYSKK
eukprot:CAMPEP_0198286794 /NCGR_PEP_ID=MMETSP1449-20131203/5765_1 /TAXON_ID=420275 /ORGANISM="Attheya septentrionalis, Strain CCMP2084" /LENGTH=665 /DNA_ID=CAMNT_0043984599 /DNA_START=89 /DNA_END=2083 /DNA_ORIENTATION=-